MKKLFFVVLLGLSSISAWAQNNVIRYTAAKKLPETTDVKSAGLHVNAFNVSVSSHVFAGGTGTITFEDEVTHVNNRAFYRCTDLVSVILPNSVVNIGDSVFMGCTNLSSPTIPTSLTRLGCSAFSGCTSLASIVLPNTVRQIGDHAFNRCTGLNSIIIPSSIQTINEWTFSDCSNLTSVVIPPYVTTIDYGAFSGCSALSSLVVPKSIQSLGDYAFYNCTGLTYITTDALNPPLCGSNCFTNVHDTIPLFVPATSLALYKSANQWREFDVQARLISVDSIRTDSTNLKWYPVDSASQYLLRIYSDQIRMDTTLYINADATKGGIMLPTEEAPQRQCRIVLDQIGSTVVISIDPNSGTAPDLPFVVEVSTTSEDIIYLNYEIYVLGVADDFIHQEVGMFTLNDNVPLFEALDVPTTDARPQKILRDNQILIFRDGVVYTLQGQVLATSPL